MKYGKRFRGRNQINACSRSPVLSDTPNAQMYGDLPVQLSNLHKKPDRSGWTGACFFTRLSDEGTATFSPRSRLLTAQGPDGVKRLLRPEKPERAYRETK